jgi:hypothetical protein
MKLPTLSLALVAAVAGCATPKTAMVNGRAVPRLSLEFGGQPYQIKHEGAHPEPGRPSGGLRDVGGRIHGHVCGMFVDFDVTHKGDHVQLVGSIDSHINASIDVSDENGMRHFTGTLGTLGIDFIVNTGGMQGHVGIRVFALDAGAADDYAGYMRIPGLLRGGDNSGRLAAALHGREALWAMPAADQAAVLPAILTCGSMQFRVVDDFDAGFGGHATERPPETSAVYTNM